MTLIGGRASDGVGAGAGATLAGVGLGAFIAVATNTSIGFSWIGTGTSGSVTGPSHVALVRGSANFYVGAGADTRTIAAVCLSAGITVGTWGPVGGEGPSDLGSG